MLTLRKKIAGALEAECLDLREISRLYGIREREALDHLQHIAKSAHPKRLIVEAASCKQCGFSFKKRTRLNAPGRCPICKSESISPPRFRISLPKGGDKEKPVCPRRTLGQQDPDYRHDHPSEKPD